MIFRFTHNPNETPVRDTHPELPLDPDVVKPGVYKWPVHFTPALLMTVFIGGCLGAAARYWVSLQLPTGTSGWPFATLVINLLGALLLGLLLEGLARLGTDEDIRRIVRLGVGTGFIGAFTTYSTLALEIDLLIRSGNHAVALWYGAVSIAGGFVLSIIGIQIAAIHHKRSERKS